jgi:hypothetical protein
VLASIGLPLSSISSARLRPMFRLTATMGVEQKSPIFTPGVANVAFSEATARSQVATSWHPAAVAIPWTAAMTGWGTRWIVCISRVQMSNTARSSWSERSISSFRSCPAEKAGPVARTTMARTSGRALWRSSCSVSSAIRAVESALRCCGRLRVMRTAGRASSTSR